MEHIHAHFVNITNAIVSLTTGILTSKTNWILLLNHEVLGFKVKWNSNYQMESIFLNSKPQWPLTYWPLKAIGSNSSAQSEQLSNEVWRLWVNGTRNWAKTIHEFKVSDHDLTPTNLKRFYSLRAIIIWNLRLWVKLNRSYYALCHLDRPYYQPTDPQAESNTSILPNKSFAGVQIN